MTFHRTFKFRIYPTPAQEASIVRWNGALRFLWNLAHEQRLHGVTRPRSERKYYTAFDQIRQVTPIRSEFPWLSDVPRCVADHRLIELDRAWQLYFSKQMNKPHWAKKSKFVPVCAPVGGWRLRGNQLTFPKLGRVRVVKHRDLVGTPKTCALVRDANQWFVSIVCRVERAVTVPTSAIVGLDRGCVNTVADSNGRILVNPKHRTTMYRKLARLQRAMKRKVYGSANRTKALCRLLVCHQKISRARHHFIHNISHHYANNHGVVVVEKLDVIGMSARHRGSNALSGMITDTGWGLLVEQLKYKLAWRGGSLIEVDPAYTSRMCSVCSAIDKRSRRTQDKFCCTTCGHTEHADVNAAKNIKSRASRAVLPVEGTVPEAAHRSRKSLRVVRHTGQRRLTPSTAILGPDSNLTVSPEEV